MAFQIEKQTSLWIGIFIFSLAVIQILASALSGFNALKWTLVVVGFFLSGLLFFEAGVIEYFRKKEFKTIGFGDVVVWLTLGVAIGIFFDTLLVLNVVQSGATQWMNSFVKGSGISLGIGAGILAIVHMIYPRFK